MKLSRRKLIALVGGGVVVGASAGFVHVATRQPGKAIEAWSGAGAYVDPRRFALSFAILAPNPHNLQPWLADLREPGVVTVLRDPSRSLPHTDPHGRQLTIGMGCFVELLSMAAAERGYRTEFSFFPEGESGPVARIALVEDAAVSTDPLFAHVLSRRSCKEPFEDRPLSEQVLDGLSRYAQIVTDTSIVARIRELTIRAWDVESLTPRTHKESVDLMRLGKGEIEANPDGIDLGGGMLELLIAGGMLSRDRMLDPSSSAFAQGRGIYHAMLSATPAYAVVTSETNTRLDQIDSGRRWLRLNLATTAAGLALHPVSQSLQEYPEMAPLHDEVHDILALPGHTIQMLGRLGHGPQTRPSPRWPLEEKILDA